MLLVLFLPLLLAFPSLVVFPTYEDATSKDSEVKRINFTKRAELDLAMSYSVRTHIRPMGLTQPKRLV